MSSPRLSKRERNRLLGFLGFIAFGPLVAAGLLRPSEFLFTSLAVVGAVLLGAGALWLGRSLIRARRWTRPVRFLDKPIPSHWHAIVDETFPLSRRLDAADFERLLRYVQVFVLEKRFEGCGGLEVTEEIRISIAAQACYLLLHLEAGCYPDLTSVLVYPSTYTPGAAPAMSGSGRIVEPPTPRLGESWLGGTVVVSWDAVWKGAANMHDGQNVVFHEFAHRLDQQDGVADGVPAALPASSLKTWAAVVGKHQERLRRARKRFRRTVLRKYGGTNRAELFAVATEAFFEKPYQLKKKVPDLYAELEAFYGRDPASETERTGGDGNATLSP